MSYELTLSIAEDSPEGRLIDTKAEAEHLSREEAARKTMNGIVDRIKRQNPDMLPRYIRNTNRNPRTLLMSCQRHQHVSPGPKLFYV